METRFADRLSLHEVEGAIEIRIGAIAPEMGCPRYNGAFFQITLVELAGEIEPCSFFIGP